MKTVKTSKTKTKKSTGKNIIKRAATAPKSTKTPAATTSAAKSRKAKPALEITTERISIRAHAIWEEQGRPQGREVEHWLLAESQLKAAQSFAA